MGKRRWCCWALVGLLGARDLALAADTGAWTLGYENKSTNALVWDKRLPALLHAQLPARVAAQVERALGGPPEPVEVRAHRYVSASACVPHDCLAKGFFWIDTATGASLGARVGVDGLLLGSNSMRADALPAPAMMALRDWIDDNAIAAQQVGFVTADGSVAPLAASAFQPRPRFVPAQGGPSFDCAAASTPIETAICADPALAQADLAMQRRYDAQRQGLSDVPGRTALRDFQRHWLAERDRDCSIADDASACLARSYAAQVARLDQWLPPR